jgi:hypothetical protein
MPWMALGAVGGGLISGIGGFFSARSKQKAAEEALAQQTKLARETQARLTGAAGFGVGEISRAGATSLEGLTGAFGAGETGLRRGIASLGAGERAALESLTGARGDLRRGQAGAEEALGLAGTRGERALRSGLAGAEFALSPVQRLQQFAGGATVSVGTFGGPNALLLGAAARDPFAGFQQDPGFQFRREQGEGSRQGARTSRQGARFRAQSRVSLAVP